jgi:hypothetical protein
MAESKGLDNAGCVKVRGRTKSLKDFAEAGTIVVAPVQTTVRVFGIAVVNWDIGVDKVTL